MSTNWVGFGTTVDCRLARTESIGFDGRYQLGVRRKKPGCLVYAHMYHTMLQVKLPKNHVIILSGRRMAE